MSMYIDGIDISTFKATLIKKNIQNAEIITYQDWLKNAFNPLYFGQEERYLDIAVVLLVEGNTEEEVMSLISTIINKSKNCVLNFTGTEYFYQSTLESHNNNKVLSNTYELELNFKASVKYKQQIIEVVNRTTSKTINVPGNQNTPATVEITSSMDIIDIILTGLSNNPITVKNLKAGKKVIINGEDGTVLQEGINKFNDTDLWEFPRLVPGSNTITFSKANCDINIKYKPRWI